MSVPNIIAMAVLILVGGFLGYFGFWFFNHMPAKWLVDYGEEPGEELTGPLAHQEPGEDLTEPYVQRVKSYPWKFVMVAFMVIAAVKLALGDVFIACGGLMALWALMLMAVSDKKYKIVPDQLVVVLMFSAIGFVPSYFSWKVPLFGGLIAFGAMVLMAAFGYIAYRRWVIGGGDIKVYTAIGVIFGWKGFVTIFILATLVSAGHFTYLLMRKKIEKDETMPLVPYIFGATAIYLLILYPYINEIFL